MGQFVMKKIINLSRFCCIPIIFKIRLTWHNMSKYLLLRRAATKGVFMSHDQKDVGFNENELEICEENGKSIEQ